jgi:hypothetical protein
MEVILGSIVGVVVIAGAVYFILGRKGKVPLPEMLGGSGKGEFPRRRK